VVRTSTERDCCQDLALLEEGRGIKKRHTLCAGGEGGPMRPSYAVSSGRQSGKGPGRSCPVKRGRARSGRRTSSQHSRFPVFHGKKEKKEKGEDKESIQEGERKERINDTNLFEICDRIT